MGPLFPDFSRAQTCDTSYNVGAGQTYATIQAAVDAVPASLVDNPCVVIRDIAIFNEQVTVRDKTNNGFVLTIMKDPALASNPDVSPPAGSTASFVIANASVTLQGFTFTPTSSVSYGVYASSDYVRLASVTVFGAGNVQVAGLVLSSWSTLSNFSAQVAADFGINLLGNHNIVQDSWVSNGGAIGIAISASGIGNAMFRNFFMSNASAGRSLYFNFASSNTVSHTTMTALNSVPGMEAVFVSGGSSNTFTQCFIGNAVGGGININFNAAGTLISRSTIAVNAGSDQAVFLDAPYVDVADSYVYNPSGTGIRFRDFFDTVTRTTVRDTALPVRFTSGASSNTFTQGRIEGTAADIALWISGTSDYNVFSRSVIAVNASTSIYFTGGRYNLISSVTVTNATGEGLRLEEDFNTIAHSTFTSNAAASAAVVLGRGNTLTRSVFSNPAGGTPLVLAGTGNTVDRSIVTNSDASFPALTVSGSSNTLSETSITNSALRAVEVNGGSYHTFDKCSVFGGATLSNAFFIGTSSHNLITRSYINAQSGDALHLDGGGTWNTVSLSTISTLSAFDDAIQFYGASSNTVTDSILYSAAGDGMRLRNTARHNALIRSTIVASELGVYLTEDAAYNLISTAVITAGGAGAYGIRIDAQARFNSVVGSDIRALGTGGQGVSIVGSTGTSLYSNLISGENVGIYSNGSHGLRVSSNTVLVNVPAAVSNSGVSLVNFTSDAVLWNNSVLYRGSGSMAGSTSYGLFVANSNNLVFQRNRISNPGRLTGGNFMAAAFGDSDNVLFEFNDIHGTGSGLGQGNLMLVSNGSNNMRMENNVFYSSFTVIGTSMTLLVDAASQPGFVGDYNDYFAANGPPFFWTGTATYDGLSAWQAALGQDAGSVSADPLWNDPSTGVDDFHPKSATGRYDPGTGTFVQDAASSPTIDRARPAEAFSFEPSPNGSRANLGSYGNTGQASKSLQGPNLTGYTVFYSSIAAALGVLTPNPSGYLIEASTASDLSGTLSSATAAGSATSIVASGLILSTTYYFRVGSLNGAATSYASVVTTVTLAASPSPISFSGITGAQFTVDWPANGNPNGTRYSVEVSTSIAFAILTSSISTTAQSATFAPLAQNTTFFVRVIAFNLSGTPSPPALGAVITAPGVITISANRLAGVWYNDPLALFNAQGAATYHYSLTQSASDVAGSGDPTFDGSALPVTIPTGLYYFHVLGKDGSGNAVGTATFGPLNMDTSLPVIASVAARHSATDPTAIADGGSTLSRTPYFNWTAASTSPLVGYSYLLTQDPAEQPAQTVNTTLTFNEQQLTQSAVHYFKVRALNLAGSWGPAVGMSFNFTATPTFNNIRLKNNYFNPLRGDCTRLEIQTATAGRMKIELYTVLGQKVATVSDQEVGVGTYDYSWCGRNQGGEWVASGVYLMHVEAPQQNRNLKVIVLK